VSIMADEPEYRLNSNPPNLVRRPKINSGWEIPFTVNRDLIRSVYENYQDEIRDHSYSITKYVGRIEEILIKYRCDFSDYLACQYMSFDSNGGNRKSISPKALYSTPAIDRYKRYVYTQKLPTWCYGIQQAVTTFNNFLLEHPSDNDIKLFFTFVLNNKFYATINPWCSSLVADSELILDPYCVPLKILWTEGMRMNKIYGVSFIRALMKAREAAIEGLHENKVLEYL
jgi:hypothetical protein